MQRTGRDEDLAAGSAARNASATHRALSPEPAALENPRSSRPRTPAMGRCSLLVNLAVAVVVALIVVSEVFAQIEITDYRLYGTEYIDRCYSHIRTRDGGFLLSGMSWNPGEHSQAMVMKLSQEGDSLWTRICSIDGILSAAYTFEREDSSLVVISNVRSSDQSRSDIMFIYLSSEGDSMGARLFEGGGLIECTFAAVQDSFVYAVGRFQRDRRADYDFWVMKLTLGGEILWTQSYGSNLAEYCTGIKYIDFDEYLLYGYRGGGDWGDDYMMMIITADGDSLGSFSYRDPDRSRCYAAEFIGDTCYLFGRAIRAQPLNVNIFIVAVSRYFRLQWTRLIGVNELDVTEGCYTSIQVSDSIFFLAGDFSGSLGLRVVNINGIIVDSAETSGIDVYADLTTSCSISNGTVAFAGEAGRERNNRLSTDFLFWSASAYLH